VFTFAPGIPAKLNHFLVPLVQAWIDRADHAVFGFETMAYGLVSFRRTPWPLDGSPTVIGPAGEVDQAALDNFAAGVVDDPNGLFF
jgi:hypothetical protein